MNIKHAYPGLLCMHWKDKTWEDTASEHGYSIHVLLLSNRS